MKCTRTLLLFFMVSLANSSYSDPSQAVLHIENALYKNRSLYCEEEILMPADSDFEILEYDLMSSEQGDRYALLNVKNSSSGQRILTQENVVGVYANCESKHPSGFKKTLSGGEVITLTISFGKSRFPIIKVIGNDQL